MFFSGGHDVLITREKALRIFRVLRTDNPKKWMDLLSQFESMSKGSPGPWLPEAYSRIRVRDHYYPKWADEDFQWVLSHVTGSG
jgi:hypothetical protein